jgi:hypothetical protein
MRFTIQRTFSDYFKLYSFLLFRKTGIKILGGLYVYNLISVILQSLGLINVISNITGLYIIIIVIPLLFLLIIYLKAKQSYSLHKSNLIYEINEDDIIITGEGFQSQKTWAKCVKIEETKSWFLIAENKYEVDLLPKREMQDHEVSQLRSILSEQRHVQIKLLVT